MWGQVVMKDMTLCKMQANGIEINVAQIGEGAPVLLLHGWPHTWMMWREVMPLLAASGRRVIAPDLRGLGGSSRADGGYDLHTLADDMVALLVALEVSQPVMVASLDLGSPVALMLAMRHPEKVRGLSVCETVLGDLPGAEDFLSEGPPWWFGFHAIPDLAETVLVGHEREYLEWFFTSGTKDGLGIASDISNAFVEAYTGRKSLECGFNYYRAMKANAEQIRGAFLRRRLTTPTLAAIGGLAGDVAYKQLVPFADHLERVDIPGCGHLVPLEQPRLLAEALIAFDLIARAA